MFSRFCKNMCVFTWKKQIYQTYWYFDMEIADFHVRRNAFSRPYY